MMRRPLDPLPVDLEDSVDITSPSVSQKWSNPLQEMASSVEQFCRTGPLTRGIATQLTRLGDQYKNTGCYGV